MHFIPWLVLALAFSASADDGDWYPIVPQSSPVNLRGFEFLFKNPQASETNNRYAPYSYPFFPPQFGVIHDQSYPKPSYAPTYPQTHRNTHPKYVIPKQNYKKGPYKALEKQKVYKHPQNQPYNKRPQVFHPYDKLEANLNGYHDDPVALKIKNDINANAKRLKQKEKLKELHNGDSKTRDSEEEISEKFNRNEQNENFTPRYEPHNALKRPKYYKPPKKYPINYSKIENKLKYPRPNFENVKIHPSSYLPLKNKIHQLKRNQGKTFSEGGNEYPELKTVENERVPDGHDIYDRQKQEFDAERAGFNTNFRDFSDEHYPNSALKNNHRPKNDDEDESSGAADEFIPIKMYAQVRHSESVKHLPREAALEDAETYDDVLNAPRLKEAIKVSKAQTVYSEEGYEDSAYDHAGHLKHASNHEGHGGYVKNKENSAGKYRDGGGSKYEDGGRSLHGGDISKGKKWFVDEGSSDEFDNESSFSVKEKEHKSSANDLDEAGTERKPKTNSYPQKFKAKVNKFVMTADVEETMVKDTKDGVLVNTKSKHVSMNNEPENPSDKPKYVRLRPNYYWKKNKLASESNITKNGTDSSPVAEKILLKKSFKDKILSNHKLSKRESGFFIPKINFEETFLTDAEILKISKEKLRYVAPVSKTSKYPYYNINALRDSPLKYAENMANIPRKTKGGSEFYDSRTKSCDDVVSDIDPIPERIKNKTPESESEEDEDFESEDDRKKRHVLNRKKRDNFEQNKQQPRLKGLGDKIDCFKEKYFGENPLDSPFFDEDEIEPPEPIQMSHGFAPLKRIPNLKYNKVDSFTAAAAKPTVIYEEYYDSKEKSQDRPLPINRQKEVSEQDPILLTGETDSKNDASKLNDSNQYVRYIVSVPKVVFDKYTVSDDPRAHVYGDVMDNIRVNLNSEKENVQNDDHSDHLNVGEIEKDRIAKISKPSNLLYKSFKNKNEIRSPYKQVRITRDNQFVYEPYKIIHQQNKKSESVVQSLRPKRKKARKINPIGQASSTIETIVDLSGQPVKRNVKTYTDIGKNDRRTANNAEYLNEPIAESSVNLSEENETAIATEQSFDYRRGEPRYENGEEKFHKNHKKYHSPVTIKTSIKPEELDVEYLLKSNEDGTDTQKYDPKTTDDEEETEGLLIEDIATKVTLNYTNDEAPSNLHRFNGKPYFKPIVPRLQTVFDVSAYLPKPIIINNLLPRYNYSSRYNANEEILPEATEDTTSSVDTDDTVKADYENIEEDIVEQTTPKIRPILKETVRIKTTPDYGTVTDRRSAPRKRIRLPSTYSPIETTTQYIFNRNIARRTTEKPLQFIKPKALNKRRRIKLSTSTTTQQPTTEADYEEESYYGPIVTTNKYIEIPRTTERPVSTYNDDDEEYVPVVTEGSINDDSKLDQNEKPNIDDVEEVINQWKKVLHNTTPVSDEKPRQISYRRTTRPTVPSNSQITNEKSPEHETVSRKPRILEKTSKKRKTTVITNSKRYDTTMTPEPYTVAPKPRGPVRRRPLRGGNRQVPIKDDGDELEIKETGSIIPHKYEEDDVQPQKTTAEEEIGDKEESKLGNLRQAPIEESRYEEDVEEEEVIKERPVPYSSKPFDYYRDPNLAKNVNRLSEIKNEEDQHPIHTDVEIFSTDFEMNKGPKHGGNYKRIPSGKKSIKKSNLRYKNGELEDLNSGYEIEGALHGGNYRKVREDSEVLQDRGISAKVLNSFVSLEPIATTTPKFEENPGNRLYYFAKVE